MEEKKRRKIREESSNGPGSSSGRYTSFKATFLDLARVEITDRSSDFSGWKARSINPGKRELTFEIRHGEPVAVDPRRVDVRVKGPEGRRAHIVKTLQHERW